MKKARYYIGGGILLLLVISLLYIFSRVSPVGKNSETNDEVSAVPSENKASEEIPAIVKESHAAFMATVEDPDQRARYEAYTKTQRYRDMLKRTRKQLEEQGYTFTDPEERARKKALNKQRLDAAMARAQERQAYFERQNAHFAQIREELRLNMAESRERSARRKQWMDKILSDPRSLPEHESESPHQQADSSDRIIDAPETHPSEHTTDDPSPFTWQETLSKSVSEITEKYPAVSITPYLTPKEFEEFFPTEDSRVQLQARQQQMQAEMVQRVKQVLAEDPGNREEKLSVIRQTLTENWSPDIAESVLEQLR